MLPTRRGILYVTAVVVVLGPMLVWFSIHLAAAPSGPVNVPIAYAATPLGGQSTLRQQMDTQDDALALAKRDPLGLVRRGHERFKREIRDYRCVLLKQELIKGQLSPVQEIEVRVRNSPRIIYMLWRQNATQAKRALYKEGDPTFVDDQGRQLALVEPAGAVVRLFIKDIFMPIRGVHASKASRRTIDECGFGASFELMEHYCQLAHENGVLDLMFGGTAEVDGRPTLVLVRHLPYAGEDGVYPDAKLILHLDREWLLPVALESYADRAGTELLGRYVFTKVELNPGLGEQDFEF